MVKKRVVEAGLNARRTCPCLGVLCFLGAFIASLFGARSAAADGPPAAIKATPLAAPAAVLGLSNPYLVAASVNRQASRQPEVLGFQLSRSLVDLVQRVETLARDGVELNQRKLPRAEKLNLRVQSRYGGGVLQLRYQR
jgi:hypothetical protein